LRWATTATDDAARQLERAVLDALADIDLSNALDSAGRLFGCPVEGSMSATVGPAILCALDSPRANPSPWQM
jgi:hypothetical protein